MLTVSAGYDVAPSKALPSQQQPSKRSQWTRANRMHSSGGMHNVPSVLDGMIMYPPPHPISDLPLIRLPCRCCSLPPSLVHLLA